MADTPELPAGEPAPGEEAFESQLEAIKILRERTGIGLANAKVLVESASRQFVEKNPHPELTESGTGMPRLLMSLLLTLLIFAVYRHLTVG